jgi:hypothetical protein
MPAGKYCGQSMSSTTSSISKSISRVHKKLLAEGVPIFKRLRYQCLRRRERWSVKQRAQYRDNKRGFGATRFSQSRIVLMWEAKESLLLFWHYVSETSAAKYFRR